MPTPLATTLVLSPGTLARNADAVPGEIDPTAYVLIGLLGVGVVMTLVVLVVIGFVLTKAARERRPPTERPARPILDPGVPDEPEDAPRVIRLKRAEKDAEA